MRLDWGGLDRLEPPSRMLRPHDRIDQWARSFRWRVSRSIPLKCQAHVSLQEARAIRADYKAFASEEGGGARRVNLTDSRVGLGAFCKGPVQQ